MGREPAGAIRLAGGTCGVKNTSGPISGLGSGTMGKGAEVGGGAC